MPEEHKSIFNKANTAIALGNFDGFHKGHMQLINFSKAYAKEHGLVSVLFSTTPSTSEFLGRPKKVILEDKKEFIEKFKLCDIFVEYFLDDEFINTSPINFLLMLKNKLNVKAIIVGENYRFGKNAAGKIFDIEKFSKENDIYFKAVGLLEEASKIVCSTSIRNFIEQGDIEKANAFLGYNFFTKGIVTPTDGRGSSIGFPTANINLKEKLIIPKFGVYITKTILVSGESLPSVTNVGMKPTFEVELPQIETHILDKNINLYGEEIKVEFHKKIRDTIKFASLEDLIKQLKLDVQTAKNFFNIL